MRIAAASTLVQAALLCTAGQAHAEWRCDCTTILDSCSADVAVHEDWVEITTDYPQCARVDYFLDGLPFVSVVVEGEGREDWISRSEAPRVLVQSCQVCRDNSGTIAPEPVASTEGQDGEALTPLIKVEPEYPPDARVRGLEGSVTVTFDVTPYGVVENAHIVTSQPARVFDMASLSAVSRWRYPPDPDRETVTLTDTLTFSNPGGTPSASAPAAGGARVISRAAGPMNQCLRENISYDYGEMVEVGLMNACNEQLIVYACAEGTGRLAERWVCTDSESQRTVLTTPGNARVGTTAMIATPEGLRAYDYVDDFFVARAPNTEYWWLACRSSDAACRDEGRQWLRSMNRQTASIDPQQRTLIAVSRSF